MTETDSGASHVESPTSSENWFKDQWGDNLREGYTNYVLITADRFQKGKTSLAMRIGELVEEWFNVPFPIEWDETNPADFSKSNLGFDPLWYMDRQDNIPENAVLVGDEWNRVASSRQWWTPINQDFAINLQETAYQHKNGIFPLPRQKMVDNAIAEICTSHIIVEDKGKATCYFYQWDQLNRVSKARTPTVGDLLFKKPSAKRWHTYLKMRDWNTSRRREKVKERIKRSMEEALELEAASRLKREDLLEKILQDPTPYLSKTGKVSAIKIISKHKALPWNKAQVLASEANEQRASE